MRYRSCELDLGEAAGLAQWGEQGLFPHETDHQGEQGLFHRDCSTGIVPQDKHHLCVPDCQINKAHTKVKGARPVHPVFIKQLLSAGQINYGWQLIGAADT